MPHISREQSGCHTINHSTTTRKSAVYTIQVYVLLQRRLGRRSLALRSLRVCDLRGSGSPRRLEPAGSTREEPLCYTTEMVV